MFSPTSGRLVLSILQCFVCLIHCDPGLEPWTLGTEGSGAFANMRLPQTHWPPKPSRSRLRLQYQHLPTIKMWSTMIHYINFTHLNGAFVFFRFPCDFDFDFLLPTVSMQGLRVGAAEGWGSRHRAAADLWLCRPRECADRRAHAPHGVGRVGIYEIYGVSECFGWIWDGMKWLLDAWTLWVMWKRWCVMLQDSTF